MIKYILLAGFLVSCSNYPIKRGKTSIDKTESCVYRLVEKNGINATEAQRVCSDIFRNRVDNIGIRK